MAFSQLDSPACPWGGGEGWEAESEEQLRGPPPRPQQPVSPPRRARQTFPGELVTRLPALGSALRVPLAHLLWSSRCDGSMRKPWHSLGCHSHRVVHGVPCAHLLSEGASAQRSGSQSRERRAGSPWSPLLWCRRCYPIYSCLGERHSSHPLFPGRKMSSCTGLVECEKLYVDRFLCDAPDCHPPYRGEAFMLRKANEESTFQTFSKFYSLFLIDE